MTFDTYLAEQGFKPHTAQQHRNYACYFLSYIAEVSLSLEQVTYTEILDFADRLKQEERNVNLINRMLLSIRYYFSYLQDEGRINANPVIGIALKGSTRSIPHDLLSKDELNTLYNSYEIKDERTHRNKVMLGLLVYQALTREELEKLRPVHLKLREGRIQIPQVGKQNGRTLSLQPFQILDMQEYLLVIRPKLQTQSERLFTGRNNRESLKNSLLHLGYALRKLNPSFNNATQIRQSVITEWLKEKELRMVQYMSGHRYVSSTERYQTNNLDDLKEALSRFHPLRTGSSTL